MKNKLYLSVLLVVFVALAVGTFFLCKYLREREAAHNTEQEAKASEQKKRNFPLLNLEYTPRKVDLGLSVLWSSCNLGATSETEPGMYFAWGEMSPKSCYSEPNYMHVKGYSKTMPLKDDNDVVTANMEGRWHIPTIAECRELDSMCEWKWNGNYNESGVAGYVVTGPNGKSIFLPAVGFKNGSSCKHNNVMGTYWTKECYTVSWACYLSFSENFHKTAYMDRFYGCPIRPVCGK